MKQKITGVTWMDNLEARGSFPTLSISKLREGDVWQGIARFVQNFEFVFDSTNIKEILFRHDAWMAKQSRGHIDTLLENYTHLEVNQF